MEKLGACAPSRTAGGRGGTWLAVVLLGAGLVTGCSRAPDPQRELERGVAYLQEEKPAKALPHFERALAAAPPTAQALNFLAVSQLQTGQPDAAITNLLSALRLDDGHTAAHYNLGLAYLETGHPSDTVTHLRQAARATVIPPGAQYYLSLAYARLNAWPQAGDSLAAHLKGTEPTADLLNLLGIVHTRQRDYQQAEQSFRQALDRDANFAAAYYNLATVEEQHLGRPKDAMLHYQKYLDLAPKSDQREIIQQRIVEIAQKLETQPKPATTTTTTAVAAVVERPTPVVPPKPATPTSHVEAAGGSPDRRVGATGPTPPVPPPTPAPKPAPPSPPPPPPTPAAKTRPAISTQPLRAGNRARANAHFAKAVQAHQATNLTAAIAGYASAVAADASFAAAYYNLAIAYRAAGQPEKSLANYELALRANPDYTDARFNYAILLAEQGYPADAIAQYQKLVQANPAAAAAHLSLASLYARDRATVSQARHHYEAYLRLAPNSPLARDIRRWLDANR